MIDYKTTIKNIHSALSDLNIDELLIILDCIKEIPNYNNPAHINSGGYTYPSIDNVLLNSKIEISFCFRYIIFFAIRYRPYYM